MEWNFEGESDLTRLRGIMAKISFRDWRFSLDPITPSIDKATGKVLALVKIGFDAPDSSIARMGKKDVPLIDIQTKCYVDLHGTEREIVDNVWRAVAQAVLHEAAEWFRFDARYPYWPHSLATAL